jgi:hypothetical protein
MGATQASMLAAGPLASSGGERHLGALDPPHPLTGHSSGVRLLTESPTPVWGSQ